jgi:hypothetical protein
MRKIAKQFRKKNMKQKKKKRGKTQRNVLSQNQFAVIV